MKMSHLSATLLAACLALPAIADAEIPLVGWDTPPGTPLYSGVMPRLSARVADPISANLVDRMLETRGLPRIFERSGRTAVMRIVSHPLRRPPLVGILAEEIFVSDNPAYRKTAAANAPQNDVWTYFQGRLHGAQIKTHRDGDPAKYLRDMRVDDKAESFVVPDDHYDAVERRIRQRLVQAESKGDSAGASELRGQYGRLQKLGRTYGEVDGALLGRAAGALRTAKAFRAGAGGALLVATVDGAVVVYRSASGELTPDETVEQLTETATKALATGGAATAVMLMGANPVGFTVFVASGVTYLVVDYCLDELRSAYQSTPLTEGEIRQLIPRPWRASSPDLGTRPGIESPCTLFRLFP